MSALTDCQQRCAQISLQLGVWLTPSASCKRMLPVVQLNTCAPPNRPQPQSRHHSLSRCNYILSASPKVWPLTPSNRKCLSGYRNSISSLGLGAALCWGSIPPAVCCAWQPEQTLPQRRPLPIQQLGLAGEPQQHPPLPSCSQPHPVRSHVQPAATQQS